jgi:hypothetical protein
VGAWKGTSTKAVRDLDSAAHRLKDLYENLARDIETADAAETHEQLNTDHCERVVEGAAALGRFIDNEWSRLEGGSDDGIAWITRQARAKLAEALRPLVQLKMLGGVLEEAMKAEGTQNLTEEVWSRFCAAMDAAATRAGEKPVSATEEKPPVPAADAAPPAAGAGKPLAPLGAATGPEASPAPANVIPAPATGGESAPAEAKAGAPPPVPPVTATQPLPGRKRRGAQEE